MNLTIETVIVRDNNYLRVHFDDTEQGKLYPFECKGSDLDAQRLIEEINDLHDQGELDNYEVLQSDSERRPSFYLRNKKTSDCSSYDFTEKDAGTVEQIIKDYFDALNEICQESN